MTKGVDFYSLKAEQPGGKVFDFEQLRDKVVLIVNVASKWCVSYLVSSSSVCLLHGWRDEFGCSWIDGLMGLVDSRRNIRASKRCTRNTRIRDLSSSGSRATRFVSSSL